METVYRYDNGIIEPLQDDKEGFLRCKVTFMRDGVFPYLNNDGTIRMEAKLAEEIFSSHTLQSARGVPITDGHPPLSDNKGLLNTHNYKKYAKGALGDEIIIRTDAMTGDRYAEAWENVFDHDLIQDLKDGEKVEVSIGLVAMIDNEPGVYRGKRYDAAQRKVIINHIAHVKKGRAGSEVRARLDNAEMPSGMNIAVMQQHYETRGDSMDLENTNTDVRVDSEEIAESLFQKIKKFFSRSDAEDVSNLQKTQVNLENSQRALEGFWPAGDKEQANKERDVIGFLRGQLDTLQKALDEKTRLLNEALSPSRLDEAIHERMTLIDTAKSILPDFRADSLSNQEIKMKVIEKALPFQDGIRTDALASQIIDARYDAASQLARERANLDAIEHPAFSSRNDADLINEYKTKRLQMKNEE